VETCADPASWTAIDTTVEINTADQLVVRDNIAISSAARRFIRLKIRVIP